MSTNLSDLNNLRNSEYHKDSSEEDFLFADRSYYDPMDSYISYQITVSDSIFFNFLSAEISGAL